MKALTNINARSIADAVAAASAAAAGGRAFAFSGGGTDVLQQIKDGTNQADVIINLRTVREARAVSVSPTETLIGGLITLTDNWLRVSAAQELLIVATEEGNSNIREWCGQKNAENSGAQPGTKCR